MTQKARSVLYHFFVIIAYHVYFFQKVTSTNDLLVVEFAYRKKNKNFLFSLVITGNRGTKRKIFRTEIKRFRNVLKQNKKICLTDETTVNKSIVISESQKLKSSSRMVTN